MNRDNVSKYKKESGNSELAGSGNFLDLSKRQCMIFGLSIQSLLSQVVDHVTELL